MSSQPNQSLIDGIRCLQYLVSSDRAIGCRELARLMGINTTRANRLLMTMASIGLTIKHAPDDPANEVDPARRQFFEKYGHLHHLIQNPASEDLCPDQDQVVKLWNHANDLRLIWRPVERKFGAA